jgi:hypothetical protein
VRAGSSAVLPLIAIALAVCGGASARPSQVDASKSQPVPPAFLVAVTQHDAVLLDDPSPTSASFVLTTHGAAAKLNGGAITRGQERLAYVVVLTGTFVYEGARGPPGRPTPKGTVATLIVDVASGQSVGLGLSSNPVHLAQLGPVGDLMPYLRGERIPVCGAPDLKAKASFYNGAGMSLIGALHLRNGSGQRCALPKTPRVFLTWKGRTLAIKQFLTWDLPAPRRVVSVLKPKEYASVYLRWWNWCGPDPWAGGRFGPNVELRLGRGLGTVVARLPGPWTPVCGERSFPSRMGVSRFVRPM